MNKIEYVFYSGGFDTTYYLLYCLLIKKIKVQPIVVKQKDIDGENMPRISEYHEEISRQNFYKKFKIKYPKLSKNLFDLIIYENETILDEETLNIGKLAFREGIFSREINQLLYFYQVCKDKKIKNAIIGYQKNDGLNDKEKYFFKKILKFKIPLIEISKKDMLNTAKKNKFDSFLYETWSCWFPLPNNKPCGKCALCQITIIDTKLEFPKKNILI
jgi:hypothetical protein